MNATEGLEPMILACRMTSIYDDQGTYSGDTIAELKWFKSMDDYKKFLETRDGIYNFWEIVSAWEPKKPRFSEGRPGGLLG